MRHPKPVSEMTREELIRDIETSSVIVRVSACLSLVLGVFGFLASLSVWGVAVGAGAGVFALLVGWAALSEHPHGWTRRMARSGVVAGGLALVVCAVWVAVAVLGV